MFDKGGEGFFADGKRALPSPWPFLFPHPYGGTGEGSGEPSGQRQKNSPVRKGWGRLEQGEYDQQAAFPFFIPRGMMRAAGIAMPGVSVYRLAAGAGAAGPPGGMGYCHAGRAASCSGLPERTASRPVRASGAVQERRCLFALFLRIGIEQAAQCRRVQRVEVEAHPGFIQKGGQGFFRIQGALFRQPGGSSSYQFRSGYDGGHGVLLFVGYLSRVRFGKQRVFGSKGRHIWIICGLRSSSASWKG